MRLKEPRNARIPVFASLPKLFVKDDYKESSYSEETAKNQFFKRVIRYSSKPFAEPMR